MQIARRRGMKRAIVALARRLAVIMHRIWADGTEFRWTREAYRQVELVEKGNFKGQIVERAVKLLATLNDLMANYQTLRRRISSVAE
jgi:hypothetical protein